jgi:23S rRNA (uracil1939-C5)-methyltransferase
VTGESETLVVIESLAAGGDGVGRLADGMVVFVPRTAPGDHVRLRDITRRRRHAAARVADVVSAGPGRAQPPCGHFARDRCGGCQWQHLPAAVQAGAKSRIVGDALRRIGALAVGDPPIVPSPRALAYRATITLTVKWSGGSPVCGFHDVECPERVFPLERCHIARESVQALWDAIRPAAPGLPRGDDVRLKLRQAADESLHVMIEGGEGAWTGAARIAAAAAAAGIPATVWWKPRSGAFRRLAGPPASESAVTFSQVNPEVARLLREEVVKAVTGAPDRPLGGKARVLDLYGGSGQVALALAGIGCDVTLVELEQRAVAEASRAAGEMGVSLECVAGPVEKHLDRLLPADCVVLNPPRSGVADSVARLIGARRPPRLIYVSCDPATLARDLRRMGVREGEISVLRGFDMFPMTSHVETLVVADRPAA